MKVKYLYLIGALIGFTSLVFAVDPLNPFFLFAIVIPFLTLKKFVDFLPKELLEKMDGGEMKAFQRGIEFGVRTEEGIIAALVVGAILLIRFNPMGSLFLALIITNMVLSATAAEITLEKSERIEAKKKGRETRIENYRLRDFFLNSLHQNPRRIFIAFWYAIDCLFFRKARSRLEPYFEL